MNIVGQMLCRNEADVIIETVCAAMQWFDTLVVLDGASDDGTLTHLLWMAEEFKDQGKNIFVRSRADPGDRFADDMRNELLDMTGDLSPDWVISVDADEIYDTYYDHNENEINPVTAIYQADAVGANVIRSHVPQFWLTIDDLKLGAVIEDVGDPVQVRRRWYSWGHMGTFIWKWNDDHYYPDGIPKRTPELPGKTWREWQVAGPLMPICKHYCVRSVEQGVLRAKTRLTRGGRRYFGKYGQNWLIDEEKAGLYHLGPDGLWQTEPNHDRVCQYMAGELVQEAEA